MDFSNESLKVWTKGMLLCVLSWWYYSHLARQQYDMYSEYTQHNIFVIKQKQSRITSVLQQPTHISNSRKTKWQTKHVFQIPFDRAGPPGGSWKTCDAGGALGLANENNKTWAIAAESSNGIVRWYAVAHFRPIMKEWLNESLIVSKFGGLNSLKVWKFESLNQGDAPMCTQMMII